MRLRTGLTRVTLCAALFLAVFAARRPTHHVNTFSEGDALELRVFMSPSPRFSAFSGFKRMGEKRRQSCPVASQANPW